jgi:uncharacterized membrane protein YkoI
MDPRWEMAQGTPKQEVSVACEAACSLTTEGMIMHAKYKTSALLSLILTGAALAAHASPGTSIDSKARIKMPDARRIALKAYPGKIIKEELEKETGGSGLRYSFDIQSDAGTHEVGVDAKNGKILENSVESADND